MLKKCIIAITVLFLAVCTYGIVLMNIKYPEPSLHEYQVGEKFQLGNIEYRVENATDQSASDFARMYQIPNYYKDDEKQYNIRIQNVTLHLKNCGQMEETPEIYHLTICGSTGSNGVSLDDMQEIYGDKTTNYLMPTLQPDEEITVHVIFENPGVYYGVDHGSLFDHVPIKLAFSLYPDQYVVDLNQFQKTS